jgi:hypothetical protein
MGQPQHLSYLSHGQLSLRRHPALSSSLDEASVMPEVLTQKGAPGPSARWPDKSRNGGRLHVGMLAGLCRNPHGQTAC